MREVTDAFDTGNMPSEAATFISEVSKYRTIHPGDVLWMGVDSVPQNMKIDDPIEIEISGIASLLHNVMDEA
jgi:2-keto-4-pentenoate hydratase/2-oxohepta-3-ene-1,7-dioic acid hydratase in catechol pathway